MPQQMRPTIEHAGVSDLARHQQQPQRLAAALENGHLDEIEPIYDRRGKCYVADDGLRRLSLILSRLSEATRLEQTLAATEREILDAVGRRPHTVAELARRLGVGHFSLLRLRRIEEHHLVQRCGLRSCMVMTAVGLFFLIFTQIQTPLPLIIANLMWIGIGFAFGPAQMGVVSVMVPHTMSAVAAEAVFEPPPFMG